VNLGTRKQLLGWAAAAHLLIALVYSTHLPVEYFIPRAMELVVRTYGNYSGAHMHFNFFAPTVPTQVRVQFRLGAGDRTLRTFTVAADSFEVNQRLATMFNFYSYPTLRAPLADAWMTHVLGANAEAEWVQARVEVLDIPSLEQLAAGKKAQWVEIGRHGAARGGAPVR
jgi:hypothetical protein